MIQSNFPMIVHGRTNAFPMVQAMQCHRITVRFIQETVADYYDLRLSDMFSDRRSREVARPRQVAMFLARDLTPKSLPSIGKLFGGRDHTTVIHAIRHVEALCKVDGDICADVEALRARLAA